MKTNIIEQVGYSGRVVPYGLIFLAGVGVMNVAPAPLPFGGTKFMQSYPR